MQLAFHFDRPAARLVERGSSVDIELPNPVLAGPSREQWATGLGEVRRCGSLTLWRQGSELWGVALYEVDAAGFAAAAEALYADLLRATRHVALQRIWNFVPAINACRGRLENYRAFCQGRFEAFRTAFADTAERHMPAASAVGTAGDRLCAVFVAGTDPVQYVENPEQVPAYRYPAAYGPRAPSFARASLIRRPGCRRLYVSGTASIRASESRHHGDVAAQLALALDNVDVVARAAGLTGLNRDSRGQRRFRVYVRRPEHQYVVQRGLREKLLRGDDRWSVVQADICRRELLVEIEACVDVRDPTDAINEEGT